MNVALVVQQTHVVERITVHHDHVCQETFNDLPNLSLEIHSHGSVRRAGDESFHRG